MDVGDFNKELDDERAKNKEAENKQAELKAINKAGIKNVEATNANTKSTAEGLKNVKGEVKVTNPDLAKTDDMNKVTDAINRANLTAYMSTQGLPQLAENLVKLTEGVDKLSQEYESKGLNQAAKQLALLVDRLGGVSRTLSQTEVKVDKGLQKTIDSLSKSIDKIDFKPQVNVSAPDTKVVTTPIDLTPIEKPLQKILLALETKEREEPTDLGPVTQGLSDVQQAISGLRFPVPNYVLPFKDVNGRDVQVQLDSSGNVPTSGGAGGGSTQYTDGGTPPTHPIGNAIEWNDGSVWQTASTAKPLPVSATFSGSLTSSPTFAQNPAAGTPTAAFGLIDSSFRPQVSVATALPAGTNVIGHTISDSGSTTAVTQATGTNLHTVVDSGAIAATLSAETTKVIGTVNQGTSPWVVSGSFSSTPPADVAPATQNVTVVDSGSTSTVSNNGQVIVTGSPTANSAASFTLSSLETVRVQVTGTWTGTLATEISIDGGTTWFAQGLHQGAYTTSTFFGNFVGGGSVTGATNFRVRATATVTGTAVVKIIESINTNSVYIANAAPAGTVVSLLNSSTATLLSGAVFTGSGEDVSNFSEMRISVISNVASATDGLSIQQSPDNTNWDIVDTYTIAAATAKTFVVPRQARYFRIVYTNSGTNQASFRLQSILNRTATAPSSNRASDGYTNETDLVQNQTFPMVYNGTTWDRLRGDATNGEFVQLKTAIPAGTNVIGHVINDTGSTTAVTGNVSVVQATGTNLHAVIDTGSTTAVTQATAANLNATVVGTGTFATQATLAAETTKVIGTVNQGTNPWVTSNATTSVVGNGAAATAQRVTLANDSTGIIATVGAVTAITNALPAGANAIGKLAANGGVIIGDVNVVSEIPGVGATNLGKAEDAAHTTGDTGVMALGVRNDTLATTTNTTADYTQLTTDQAGVLITAGAPRALKGRAAITITSSTAETTVLAATASTFHDAYGLILTNTSATVTKVTIRDATGAGTATVFEVPATDTRGFMLPVDSAIPQGAVNTAWTAQCGTSVSALEVTLLYVSRV